MSQNIDDGSWRNDLCAAQLGSLCYLDSLESDLDFTKKDLIELSAQVRLDQLHKRGSSIYKVTTTKPFTAQPRRDVLHAIAWFDEALSAYACFQSCIKEIKNEADHIDINTLYLAGIDFFLEWRKKQRAAKQFATYVKANGNTKQQEKIIAELLNGKTAYRIESDLGIKNDTSRRMQNRLNKFLNVL